MNCCQHQIPKEATDFTVHYQIDEDDEDDGGTHCIMERMGIKRRVELIDDSPFAASAMQNYFICWLFFIIFKVFIDFTQNYSMLYQSYRVVSIQPEPVKNKKH